MNAGNEIVASGRQVGTRGWLIRLALTVILLGPLTASPGAAQVQIADLGTLGGVVSSATAINGSGQVVGWSTTAGGTTHAFLYADGVLTDLGTLPGGTNSYATAINDRGEVAGYGGINEYGPQFREFTQGFIWQGGALQAIGSLHCPCTVNQRYGASAAYGINASRQIVGDSGTLRGEPVRHAFLWQGGQMDDLGGGPGSFSTSVAFGVNDAGWVAGAIDGQAAVWRNGVVQLLGTLPGHVFSTARGVSGPGQVVGDSAAAGGAPFRAFLWDSAGMHDLGTLSGDPSSQARAVNSAGQVVGWSGASDGSDSRAFLWQNGTLSDLNSLLPAGSGWTLTSAAGINDAGQIVGVGLHNGETRAFLLTLASAAESAALTLALAVNQLSFSAGQSLNVTANAGNSGTHLIVDLYLGVVLPDGDTLMLCGNLMCNFVPGRLSVPVTAPALMTGVDVSGPFALDQSRTISYTWMGGEPAGEYTLFFAAVVPGGAGDNSVGANEVLALTTATFRFVPGRSGSP